MNSAQVITAFVSLLALSLGSFYAAWLEWREDQRRPRHTRARHALGKPGRRR